jgi:SAM-dependent methyltransferase
MMTIGFAKRLIDRARQGKRRTLVAPPEAFASHLPILIGLGQTLPIRRVLELGCGTFSTPTFLDRRFFPLLEELHSLENEAEWIRKAEELTSGDPRWTPSLIEGAVANAVSRLDLEFYDLVMIDDSHTYAERARTIETIAQRKPHGGLYLIHDFESSLYQRASRPFKSRFTFDALLPKTGANWNHTDVDISMFERLNAKIRPLTKRFNAMDVNAWFSALCVSSEQ